MKTYNVITNFTGTGWLVEIIETGEKTQHIERSSEIDAYRLVKALNNIDKEIEEVRDDKTLQEKINELSKKLTAVCVRVAALEASNDE